jgi:DNA modification methylase/ParB-like chromosome segregation protein Spo0J
MYNEEQPHRPEGAERDQRSRRQLSISEKPIASLRPLSRNARRHSKKQLHQIAESIRFFGFTVPVLLDAKNRIIAGHGRVEAAKILNMETVPCIAIADLSDEEVRAYAIADNRIAENADWDADALKAELKSLSEAELDFDLELTGFDMGEMDTIMDGGDVSETGRERVLGRSVRRRRSDADDDVAEADQNRPAITRPGTIWLMGEHRLICADSTKPESYDKLLGFGLEEPEAAEMVFTDPPYNVPIGGHVSGLGKVTHREFAMASGEMTAPEFQAFLSSIFTQCARVSKDGSVHYLCMDWRHMRELLGAADGVYSALLNLCVWNKDNGGMGSLYRSKHELVFVFKKGDASHINNVKLGNPGRYRTNVWDYPGVNSFSGRDDLEMHPTAKPVALIADAIRDCSRRGGIVLDPFGGSGSTLIAAERTGRKARLIELDPHYCDTIVRRWQKLTGGKAIDAPFGDPFGSSG